MIFAWGISTVSYTHLYNVIAQAQLQQLTMIQINTAKNVEFVEEISSSSTIKMRFMEVSFENMILRASVYHASLNFV